MHVSDTSGLLAPRFLWYFIFMEGRQPKVGIGVLVFKDGKILLGKRKNSHDQ
jgi:hypothetical protein